MGKTSLNIFAKSPVLGTVKTRMSPPLSSAQCLRLHQALLTHTLSCVQPLSSSEIELALCFTGRPEDALEEAKRLAVPKGFLVDVQQGEHLGDRLKHALATRMHAGYSKVIFIGTDCPQLGLETVLDAIESLRVQEVVIGPAEDGGYYLIGFSSYLPEILEGIPWGTRRVFDKTVEKLGLGSVRWEALDWRSDLDTFDDLKRFGQPDSDGSSNATIHQSLAVTLEKILNEVCRFS